MTRSSFPALVIAPLTMAVCIFACHLWLRHWLPGISVYATVDPSLTILDIPVQLPFPVDLILVTALFIILYSIIILVVTSGSQLKKRFSALVISLLIIVSCLALGNLLSWLLRGYFPPEVRNSLSTMAVNADFHFPYSGYPNLLYRGDAFSFFGLVIGMILSIRIMNKTPQTRPRFRLTREQRMTPYARMLAERRTATTVPPIVLPIDESIPSYQSSPTHHRYLPSHGLCHNEPISTLQPEAVSFRPLS